MAHQCIENHPCRGVVSIKLLCDFIEITLRRGCSSVNLLHIFRAPFFKNTYGRLLPVPITLVLGIFHCFPLETITVTATP